MTPGEFAAIEARASAVADAFHDDVPLIRDTYVWKYAPGQQKYFTSMYGEQGEIASVEGWDDHAAGTVEALIDAVTFARSDAPRLLAAVRERDNTIARVRALHVRNQDGSWTCGDWECEKCTLDDGHHGPVCDTCSFSTDDDTVPSVVFWPCPTVQIIDGLPAPGLRAALDPQETP